MIGCPTASNRNWVNQQWFLHAEAAARARRLEPEYVFVVPEGDTVVVDALTETADDLDRKLHIVALAEKEPPDERRWDQERVAHMVDVRNALLARVRELAPQFFLSVDSDVLLAERAVTSLMEVASWEHPPSMRGPQERPYDVVGGKCYLSQVGDHRPSYAQYNNQSLQRPDTTGIIPVDLVFAIKLMRPTAYNVDYEFHWLGEDVGWGLAVKRRGMTMAWDGRVVSKHVFHPNSLDVVDRRVGF